MGTLALRFTGSGHSSDGLDFVVVLGQQVAQFHLERRREHLVVGGPLFRVENERLGDLVAFPVWGDHVVFLEIVQHKGSHFGAGTKGSIVARGVDTGTL